jgi:hypothetical protein
VRWDDLKRSNAFTKEKDIIYRKRNPINSAKMDGVLQDTCNELLPTTTCLGPKLRYRRQKLKLAWYSKKDY